MTDIARHDESVATIGMDLGKNSFHLIGMDARGKVIVRQKLTRGRLEQYMATLQPCLVGVEACAGAHHIGRRLGAFGNDVRLIPGNTSSLSGQGKRTTTATQRPSPRPCSGPTMRFVPIKSAEQLDL
ncbi:hypothetical protein [Mesorhizobium sp. M1A.F.Ca.ET.072.01.1.1]|uniref:hypothetical protein n=1 Tax=Mesorhizobium sp. M1A.F.Ca.ET.072.01.1.1 TaxID=2496753 RepID=UPI001FDF2726|nr:hypothetical protein [Mesorhizobium sp. M1A.F.Ca.ET.072.01.1.1]